MDEGVDVAEVAVWEGADGLAFMRTRRFTHNAWLSLLLLLRRS